MKKAIIRKSDGHVINVIAIEKDAKYTPPKGCYLLDEKLSEKASIGKALKGSEFVDIPKPEAKTNLISSVEWKSLKEADKLDLIARNLGILE